MPRIRGGAVSRRAKASAVLRIPIASHQVYPGRHDGRNVGDARGRGRSTYADSNEYGGRAIK